MESRTTIVCNVVTLLDGQDYFASIPYPSLLSNLSIHAKTDTQKSVVHSLFFQIKVLQHPRHSPLDSIQFLTRPIVSPQCSNSFSHLKVGRDCFILLSKNLSVFVVSIVPLNHKPRRLQYIRCFVVVVDVPKDNTQKVKDWYFSFQQKRLTKEAVR